MSRKVALLAVILALTLIQLGDAFEPASDDASGRILNMPKLFQFERYKELFNKRYSNLSEELVRRKIFLARAFRAFISSASYKFRRMSYFLSVNQFSDRTKVELKQDESLMNPMTGIEELVEANSSTGDVAVVGKMHEKTQPEAMANLQDLGIRNLRVERSIEQQIEHIDTLKHGINSMEVNELDEAQDHFSLVQHTNQPLKESVKCACDSNETNLSVSNNVIQRSVQDEESTLLRSNIEISDPPDTSNQLEVDNEGDVRRQRYSDLNFMRPHNYSLEGRFLGMASRILPTTKRGSHPVVGTSKGFIGRKVGRMLSDEVLVDHSQSGCMFPAKEQAKCSSCYALATTTYYEWLNCKSTGKLTRFAEQYMIDCGPKSKYGSALQGCRGGLVKEAGLFHQEYGFEMGTRYPYIGREGSCPYDPVISTQMGFMRYEGIPGYVRIPLKSFSKYIKFAPILVGLGIAGDFKEYGGGVHSGKRCCEGEPKGDNCASHAVLLIGHGRQDGEDYWLIRNSYSIRWGEAGNYKLKKKSDCIRPHSGVVFGTADKVHYSMSIARNKAQQVSAHAKLREKVHYKLKLIEEQKSRVKNRPNRK